MQTFVYAPFDVWNFHYYSLLHEISFKWDQKKTIQNHVEIFLFYFIFDSQCFSSQNKHNIYTKSSWWIHFSMEVFISHAHWQNGQCLSGFYFLYASKVQNVEIYGNLNKNPWIANFQSNYSLSKVPTKICVQLAFFLFSQKHFN